MIIGVTLLSSFAALAVAAGVGLGGGGWLAILGSFLATNWLVALALIGWVVLRDLTAGGPGNGLTATSAAPSPIARARALQEVPLHNRSRASTGKLHA